MTKQSTNSAITKIPKEIFAAASKIDIFLTPKAYHLLYDYFSGDNKDLIQDIDEMLSSAQYFSQEVVESLYFKHIVGADDNDEKRIINQVHKETQEIIKNIFTELIGTGDITSTYGDKLENYVNKINSANEISSVKEIMKELVADTNQMAASSQKLQDKLTQATTQTEHLREQLKATEKDALIDALTTINNRLAFDRKINELLQIYKKEREFFAVIMLDIDFFKKFNDKYGHKVGDLVLHYTGTLLRRCLKGSDFPARYGGEEFIVLLPNTSLENAKIVAEQLRVQLSVKKITNNKTGEALDKLTASLGVSFINLKDTVDSVVDRADKALYLAKESGRNNVKTELDLT
ncbi:MAG: diguanylate cyclase [Proteobacteria bacterium]|nr:diguanylate cyclase [Pseudomonadota bacterium]MBU1708455.1 diguanylate cyclase [Pseudomonadota bacterium]